MSINKFSKTVVRLAAYQYSWKSMLLFWHVWDRIQFRIFIYLFKDQTNFIYLNFFWDDIFFLFVSQCYYNTIAETSTFHEDNKTFIIIRRCRTSLQLQPKDKKLTKWIFKGLLSSQHFQSTKNCPSFRYLKKIQWCWQIVFLEIIIVVGCWSNILNYFHFHNKKNTFST